MIKLYHYNGTKLKDFYMGPSVKFVLPIIDAFPDKKNGGNFWCGKKGRNGGGWGGSEGVAFFGRKFSRLSFLNTSLRPLPLTRRVIFWYPTSNKRDGLKDHCDGKHLRAGPQEALKGWLAKYLTAQLPHSPNVLASAHADLQRI